jgi:methyl-accepting chemotaxis protein
MITSSVDETALSADSMSSAIASIRQSTESVAGEMEAVQNGYSAVDDKLAELHRAVRDFLTAIAA